MINHTQLINHLIERFGLESYCEIGVQNPEQNYNKIVAKTKIGVDPCLSGIVDNLLPLTSDIFFKIQTDTFSIFFIDGLHHADQVKRDFENSLRCLNDNGFIVIHDVLPDAEEGTIVPRQTKRWWGDVYKFAMSLGSYGGIRFITYPWDEGCCVVWKTGMPITNGYPLKECNFWELYKADGVNGLNLLGVVPADYVIER